MLFVESLSSLVWYMGSTFLPINLMWPCHKLDSTPVGLNPTTVTPHGASWLASSMCWPWCVVPSGFNLTGPHKLLLPRTPLHHTVDVPYGRWCHQIPIVPVVWTPFAANQLFDCYQSVEGGEDSKKKPKQSVDGGYDQSKNWKVGALRPLSFWKVGVLRPSSFWKVGALGHWL